MKIIYEPKGKAREYAPLAFNPWWGCPHNCRYCYGPKMSNPAKKGLTAEQWKAEWHRCSHVKADALDRLAYDCAFMWKRCDTRPVLMMFSGDPYPPDDPVPERGLVADPITRTALKIMQENGVTPIILTKGGMRACRDFDILKATMGWFGQTISFYNSLLCSEWEPHAAKISDRREALMLATDAGLKTWISVEPVIDFSQAIVEIRELTYEPRPDHFKLGKLSGNDKETRAIEKSIDWPEYREAARCILNGAGYREIFEPGVFKVGTYYVKAELRGL